MCVRKKQPAQLLMLRRLCTMQWWSWTTSTCLPTSRLAAAAARQRCRQARPLRSQGAGPSGLPNSRTWDRAMVTDAPVIKPEITAELRKLISQPACTHVQGPHGMCVRGFLQAAKPLTCDWLLERVGKREFQQQRQATRRGLAGLARVKADSMGAHPCAAARWQCRSSRPQRQPASTLQQQPQAFLVTWWLA